VSQWRDQYLLIADVTIKTDVPMYPIKMDGRLVFPVGTYRASLPHWELTRAIDRGQVRRVHKVALYERGPLFKSYVDFFWNKRLEAREQKNEADAWICKLMLNSLYGKFGQTGRVFDDVAKTEDQSSRSWVEWDADTKSLRKYRQFAGLIQEQARDGEARDSHPAISAHVTSAARMLLWDFIEKAGIDNVYYTDTDSLMVNAQGLDALQTNLDASLLGALKLEWESDAVVIRGAKDYSIGDHRKIKGIRGNAIEGPMGTFTQDRFRGFKGMLRAGNTDTQVISRVSKTLSRKYQKGRPGPDGRVHPLDLPSDQLIPLPSQV